MPGPGDAPRPDDAPVPALRASDADRERVADQLRRHTAEGRLDPDELDDRLSGTYAARTVGELEELTADLPVLAEAPASPERPVDLEARAELQAHLVQRGGGAAAISALCVVIWALTGADYFWPMWVILGTGVGVGATWWRGLGPGGDPVRELERAEERRERREYHDPHRPHRHHHGRHGRRR
ncbi:DUF1707 domain-containing protein [Patulibacter minatonensis]|uniref:DUF1707 domain-containing protein n=1 Tax=Patulibacter minatonensis TaxID=298163 RepID=UPI0004B586FD|nr:DUF1707 domain-containing protein [Patulibacter minatonensis]